MTEYVVLLPDDESMWESTTEENKKAVYARHEQFARLLAERGHRVTGGSELTHSREARVVRGSLDEVSVTEGPYAETVEQLTGFYLVETDDLEGLQRVCGLLADGGGAVEIRAAVDHSGSAGAA